MKKKLLAILLVVALVASLAVGLVACGEGDNGNGQVSDGGATTLVSKLGAGMKISDIKVGLICLHDTSSTYDKNFIDAMKDAIAELGIADTQLVIKTGIPESEVCYNTAKELAQGGCDVIFADSFGHESFIMQAAKEFPDVQFCHATGTQAVVSTLANYHNAFASIYEGRYLAGVAAGMKLVALYGDAQGKVSDANAVIGYVGAYPYAEVKSGYTSFYLGVKSIVPNVTMKVNFTGSWYDQTLEYNNAKALINAGCKLISQHADSWGAPTACEEESIPNVSYNGSTQSAGPNTFIVSSRIDWTPYFVYMMECVLNGYAIADDTVGTMASGSVVLTDINATVAAPNTQAKLDEVKAKLENGTLKVFDTNNFTVKGEKLTSYKADVLDMGDFVGETEVVFDGCFNESYYRSAPYFDIDIDGITIIG